MRHPNITHPLPMGQSSHTQWGFISNEEYCKREAERIARKGDSKVFVWIGAREVGVSRMDR